jgi:hypothetical protein
MAMLLPYWIAYVFFGDSTVCLDETPPNQSRKNIIQAVSSSAAVS